MLDQAKGKQNKSNQKKSENPRKCKKLGTGTCPCRFYNQAMKII